MFCRRDFTSPSCLLLAVVAQLRLARDYSVDARNSAQIFVDRAEVMVRQVLKIGPRHYLEEISLERSRNAARVKDSWWTGRMEVIQIRREMMCAESCILSNGPKSLPPPR